MNQREELIKELKESNVFIDTYDFKGIVDFILEDRKKVVQPLADKINQVGTDNIYELLPVIDRILINVGIK